MMKRKLSSRPTKSDGKRPRKKSTVSVVGLDDLVVDGLCAQLTFLHSLPLEAVSGRLRKRLEKLRRRKPSIAVEHGDNNDLRLTIASRSVVIASDGGEEALKSVFARIDHVRLFTLALNDAAPVVNALDPSVIIRHLHWVAPDPVHYDRTYMHIFVLFNLCAAGMRRFTFTAKSGDECQYLVLHLAHAFTVADYPRLRRLTLIGFPGVNVEEMMMPLPPSLRYFSCYSHEGAMTPLVSTNFLHHAFGESTALKHVTVNLASVGAVWQCPELLARLKTVTVVSDPHPTASTVIWRVLLTTEPQQPITVQHFRDDWHAAVAVLTDDEHFIPMLAHLSALSSAVRREVLLFCLSLDGECAIQVAELQPEPDDCVLVLKRNGGHVVIVIDERFPWRPVTGSAGEKVPP